jgi:curved DNA-binding protein CbpA
MTHDNKHHAIDCYTMLGVRRGSSIREIKQAFRKLSMMTHPDRGGSNEAQARINHAYEILSDPVLRRRHDEALTAGTAPAPARERRRSKQAEEWESYFHKGRGIKSFKDRARKELAGKSEEIRSGYGGRVDALRAETCAVFRKVRNRWIISACSACAFLAAGFLYPWLWAGVILSGYMMYRNAMYGAGDEAVFVLNPEWDHIIKRQARKKITLESEAMLAHLEELSGGVARLFRDLRKTSGTRDEERTVLVRMLVHFFLLGYRPVAHDRENRLVTVSNGDEKIALRYRHRTGSPMNRAFIQKLVDYMDDNNVRKGFLFSTTGFSGNAAQLAEKHAIACYSVRELNAWIGGISSGQYPGPGGDVIEYMDNFMKFMRTI